LSLLTIPERASFGRAYSAQGPVVRVVVLRGLPQAFAVA
jgi:hypothetical protein